MMVRRLVLLALAACLLTPAGARAGWVRESPGQRAHYADDGSLEKVELDADGDGRYEIVETYRSGKRTERREDRDGDGVWERVFRWSPDGTAVCTEDLGKKGLRVTTYDAQGRIRRVEVDTDRDGTPDSIWEYEDGRVVRAREPGKEWRYENGVPVEARIDTDGDGRPDRVERYGAGGKVTRVEELDPSGRVKRVWTYGPDGKVTGMEEDTDGDGRFEVRAEYSPDGSFVRRVDHDGDGVWELRERYGPGGKLLVREEDLDGDGTYDVRQSREGG